MLRCSASSAGGPARGGPTRRAARGARWHRCASGRAWGTRRWRAARLRRSGTTRKCARTRRCTCSRSRAPRCRPRAPMRPRRSRTRCSGRSRAAYPRRVQLVWGGGTRRVQLVREGAERVRAYPGQRARRATGRARALWRGGGAAGRGRARAAAQAAWCSARARRSSSSTRYDPRAPVRPGGGSRGGAATSHEQRAHVQVMGLVPELRGLSREQEALVLAQAEPPPPPPPPPPPVLSGRVSSLAPY